MAAGTSASLCMMICFLICSCETQEIIPAKKITAELGKNVVLPSQVPNNINVNNITAVEWSRSEMEPEYVLLYRGGRLDPDNQHPSYQNRVDLQDREMKDGDVSLILKKVKTEDTGRYECRVFEIGKIELISIIDLEVVEPAQEIIPAKKIPAELGKNVVLPSQVPNNINVNKIRAVEWSRPEMDQYVLLYRDGRFDPYNQHPSYQNRVDLQDKEMKDGDASLILKKVKIEDTGTYECRVFDKGKIDPISIITLEVHVSGDKDESTGDGGNKDEGEKTRIIAAVGVIFLLVVLASVGFLICRRHMRKNPNLSVPPVKAAAEQML